MNKLIVKEIKPTKRHECFYSTMCQQNAICYVKANKTGKLYLCEKHVATFLKEVGEETLAEIEGESK